jgi:NADPH2:quinone reductase
MTGVIGSGMDTAMMSLKCVKPRGMLVLYGNASGPAPPIPPFMLQEQGSIFVTRPKLHDYMASEEESQVTPETRLPVASHVQIFE